MGYSKEAALAEGWCIFETIGTMDEGTVRLEKVDEAERFNSDAEVWTHVIKSAAMGRRLHIGALEIIRAENPTEWARLTQHGIYIGNPLNHLEEWKKQVPA